MSHSSANPEYFQEIANFIDVDGDKKWQSFSESAVVLYWNSKAESGLENTIPIEIFLTNSEGV